MDNDCFKQSRLTEVQILEGKKYITLHAVTQ
jgi:hypothetical protein